MSSRSKQNKENLKDLKVTEELLADASVITHELALGAVTLTDPRIAPYTPSNIDIAALTKKDIASGTITFTEADIKHKAAAVAPGGTIYVKGTAVYACAICFFALESEECKVNQRAILRCGNRRCARFGVRIHEPLMLTTVVEEVTE